MPSYVYKARDASGNVVEGSQEADALQAVITKLRERKLYIVEIRPKSTMEKEIALPSFGGGVNGKDLAVFSRQFSTLVNAGVPILTTLKILLKQAEKRQMCEALEGVIPSVEGGQPLFESFAKYQKVFPPMFTNLVAAGEVGGVLDDVMERLAAMYERDYDITEKVKSALTYPTAILIIALLAITFLLTFVLPTFVKMLTDMNVELPLPTRIVMGVSFLLKNYWYGVLGGIIALIIGLKTYIGTPSGRWMFDSLRLKLPIFGTLNKKVISSRFTRTFSTLLRGGVPILQALEVTKNTLGNVVVESGVEAAKKNIEDGHGMVAPLEQCGVFPPMVIHMIAVGEESGALDVLLEKASAFYDKEVEYTVSRLSSMIEPIMIVVLGGLVGFIIISVMLPMFKLITSVH